MPAPSTARRLTRSVRRTELKMRLPAGSNLWSAIAVGLRGDVGVADVPARVGRKSDVIAGVLADVHEIQSAPLAVSYIATEEAEEGTEGLPTTRGCARPGTTQQWAGKSVLRPSRKPSRGGGHRRTSRPWVGRTCASRCRPRSRCPRNRSARAPPSRRRWRPRAGALRRTSDEEPHPSSATGDARPRSALPAKSVAIRRKRRLRS